MPQMWRQWRRFFDTTAGMSAARVDLAPPSEEVSLGELAAQCVYVPAEPSYSIGLDPQAIHSVQQRCAAAASRCELPNKELVEAVDAWWMERASGAAMAGAGRDVQLRERLGTLGPPAFRFQEYVERLT